MQKGVYSKNWKPVTGIKLWRTSLESPLDSKEINPVNPKGNQPWIFIGRTVAKAETPILWQPDAKNRLIWKEPDAVKDWRRGKGMTGWDVWTVSPMRCIWVWVGSRSWWWTGKPGMLQSMALQRVRQDWVTKWTELNWVVFHPLALCLSLHSHRSYMWTE